MRGSLMLRGLSAVAPELDSKSDWCISRRTAELTTIEISIPYAVKTYISMYSTVHCLISDLLNHLFIQGPTMIITAIKGSKPWPLAVVRASGPRLIPRT